MSRNQPAAVMSPNIRSQSSLKIAALSFAAVSLAATAILWQPASVAAQADPAPNTPAFYTQRVLPIFKDNCYHCHGGMFHRGGLSMSSRAGMLKGGHDGAVIVPGNAEQSLLIKLIRHEGPVDDPMPMPPKSKISDADIAVVTQWVQAGAVMPDAPPEE
ncbi:MAG TPA: c-type cytochrome domain-containing protein [Acidobacteriaceae bacterium]